MSRIDGCRICGAARLEPVLSLGEVPLANALVSGEHLDEEEPVYLLELVFCPRCSLVQITETVPPEELFKEYLYFSSFSDTMLEHSRLLTGELMASRGLDEDSLVLEIASNDGYLLQYYKDADIPVLGIEPAENIAKVAVNEKGIRTLCEFFGRELAAELAERGELADVIHAHNVLAHVADLNGLVEGIGLVLKDDGIAVIEVPYVKEMIDKVEFDTIYHEHLCYFSLSALDELFSRHGMRLVGVERVDIHGGSLRVFAGKNGGVDGEGRAAVDRLLDEEDSWGVRQVEFYRGFGEKVERLRSDLTEMLDDLKTRRGKSIAAYGASAKGTTLLNYFGIGRETLDFVVDRSTAKQGYYTPGKHLPIYAPAELLEARPGYVLLLTWNFADEILSQQAEYRERGGKFIIPIPSPRVV